MNPDARTRPRLNVAASVPESGRSNATVNVIAVWEPTSPLADVEAAIKAASRKAVLRARVVYGIESRPASSL